MVLHNDTASIPSIIHEPALMASHRTLGQNSPLTEDASMLAALPSLHTLQSGTWERVRLATPSDPNMLTLLNLIAPGKPENRQDMPESRHEYFPFRQHLHDGR